MGLKKLFICIMLLITTSGFAQIRRYFGGYVNLYDYELIDSLPLERISIYSPFDYDSEKVISTGDGTYLIEVPFKDNFIIRTDRHRTKAIVIHNSYCFGRHKEFNIEENERRIILWYEDEIIYCGYIYDKLYKVCKYFESR